MIRARGWEKPGSEWQEGKLGKENPECFAETFGLSLKVLTCGPGFLSLKAMRSVFCFRKILPAAMRRWGHILQQGGWL